MLMYCDGQRWMYVPEQLQVTLERTPNDIARRESRAIGFVYLVGLPLGG